MSNPTNDGHASVMSWAVGLGLLAGTVLGLVVLQNLAIGIAVGLVLGVVAGQAQERRRGGSSA